MSILEKIKCFGILGIDVGSSEDEIKKAYKKLALLYHPDKNESDDAKEKFQEIGYAYKFLTEGVSSFQANSSRNVREEFFKRMFEEMFFPSFMHSDFFGFGLFKDNDDSYYDSEDTDDDSYASYNRPFYGGTFPSPNRDAYMQQQYQNQKLNKKQRRKLEKRQREKEKAEERKKHEHAHQKQKDRAANTQQKPHVYSENINNSYSSDTNKATSSDFNTDCGASADNSNTSSTDNSTSRPATPLQVPLRPQHKKLTQKDKKKLESNQRKREYEMKVIAEELLRKQERDKEKQLEKERQAAQKKEQNIENEELHFYDHGKKSRKAKKREKRRQEATDSPVSVINVEDNAGSKGSISRKTSDDRSDMNTDDRSGASTDNGGGMNTDNGGGVNTYDRSGVNTDDRSGVNTGDRGVVNTDDRGGVNTDDRGGVNTDDRGGVNTDDKSDTNTDDKSSVNTGNKSNVHTDNKSSVQSGVEYHCNVSPRVAGQQNPYTTFQRKNNHPRISTNGNQEFGKGHADKELTLDNSSINHSNDRVTDGLHQNLVNTRGVPSDAGELDKKINNDRVKDDNIKIRGRVFQNKSFQKNKTNFKAGIHFKDGQHNDLEEFGPQNNMKNVSSYNTKKQCMSSGIRGLDNNVKQEGIGHDVNDNDQSEDPAERSKHSSQSNRGEQPFKQSLSYEWGRNPAKFHHFETHGFEGQCHHPSKYSLSHEKKTFGKQIFYSKKSKENHSTNSQIDQDTQKTDTVTENIVKKDIVHGSSSDSYKKSSPQTLLNNTTSYYSIGDNTSTHGSHNDTSSHGSPVYVNRRAVSKDHQNSDLRFLCRDLNFDGVSGNASQENTNHSNRQKETLYNSELCQNLSCNGSLDSLDDFSIIDIGPVISLSSSNMYHLDYEFLSKDKLGIPKEMLNDETRYYYK